MDLPLVRSLATPPGRGWRPVAVLAAATVLVATHIVAILEQATRTAPAGLARAQAAGVRFTLERASGAVSVTIGPRVRGIPGA